MTQLFKGLKSSGNFLLLPRHIISLATGLFGQKHIQANQMLWKLYYWLFVLENHQ